MARKQAGLGIRPKAPITALELERVRPAQFQEVTLIGARRNGSGPPDAANWQGLYSYSHRGGDLPPELFPAHGRLFLRPVSDATIREIQEALARIEEEKAEALRGFAARRAAVLERLEEIPNRTASAIQDWLAGHEEEQP